MSYFSKNLLFDENPVLDFVIFQNGVKLLFNCIVFVGGGGQRISIKDYLQGFLKKKFLTKMKVDMFKD